MVTKFLSESALRILGCLVLLPFLCQCQHLDVRNVNESLSAGLEVTATLDNKNPLVINWTVRNISDKPLSMFVEDLPWNTRKSICSLVTPASEPVPRKYLFTDHSYGETVIQPKSSKMGTTHLGSWFADINDHREDEALYFFWCYWPYYHYKDSEKPFQHHGFLKIPPLENTVQESDKPKNQNQPQNNP